MLPDELCKSIICTPDKKRARYTDAQGLYLEVSPSGSKLLFLKSYLDEKVVRMVLVSILP